MRHRHRRSTMRRAKRAAERGTEPGTPRRRGRSLLALLLSVVLLGVLGVGGWYGYAAVKNFFTAPDYTGAGTGDAQVQVNSGETATDIANTLFKAGVVKSAKAFVDAAKADPRGDQVQPGTYKLHKHMRAKTALTALLATDSAGNLINKISAKVTIPEGTISLAAFELLSKATKIPVADFQEAAKDPVALGVPEWWFKRNDGKPVAKSIEGFLFPATYEFNPGVDAKTVLSTMVNKFNSVNAELKFSDTVQNTRNISPYEGLIAASIAQAEAPLPEDMTKVARVLYNRVYSGKFPCSCLQLDSTVNYWLRISGKEAQDSKNLTVSQLHDPNDPYNTHDVAGMPIGPISNPGKEAMQAAQSPADGQWLYFVTIDKQGHTGFSDTFQEFQQNVELAKKNGVL
ncbi:endolytic transglycosylase MltG [Planosporangium thailandense]|uniref:endolytic transglycosylase MltG n=1 Tax=Planosporangium thailandense TaxID=765197 RepID=UPI0030B8243B